MVWFSVYVYFQYAALQYPADRLRANAPRMYWRDLWVGGRKKEQIRWKNIKKEEKEKSY